MIAHGRVCREEPCDYCSARTADLEIARDYPEDLGTDHAGERMYERYLDRMGEGA